ncbi:MAG: hypothetical protein ACYCQJ_04005 [Nitrososphaerales archaeon]
MASIRKVKQPCFWKDPLLSYLRLRMAGKVHAISTSQGIRIDEVDLLLQSLFSSTLYPVESLFEGAHKIELMLRGKDYYERCEIISNLDDQTINSLQINDELLDNIIQGQFEIIVARLNKSKLDIDRFVNSSGILANRNTDQLLIRKCFDNINYFLCEGEKSIGQALEFKKIEDIEFVRNIESDLHYIHTPRAELGFGLFHPEDPLPISVISLAKIDRPYKQQVLSCFGYDPSSCFDVPRMYHRAGAPKNASSTMLGLLRHFIKHNLPETHALITAFTPSYSSGKSMIAGGFKRIAYMKELRHVFGPVEINNRILWENLTERRRESCKGFPHKDSRMTVLPTFGLISSFHTPVFEPLINDTQTFIVESDRL